MRDKTHTNSIESVWALVQRGYVGMHHYWSIKHPQRYLNACTLRLNRQDDAVATRLTAWLAGGRHTRLGSRSLIASPCRAERDRSPRERPPTVAR